MNKKKDRVDGQVQRIVSSDFDFEKDSDPNGKTLCGKLRRKHKMKRYNAMKTACIYEGCDAVC